VCSTTDKAEVSCRKATSASWVNIGDLAVVRFAGALPGRWAVGRCVRRGRAAEPVGDDHAERRAQHARTQPYKDRRRSKQTMTFMLAAAMAAFATWRTIF
jgi:hypothetical protein